jgi:hypothetical protein
MNFLLYIHVRNTEAPVADFLHQVSWQMLHIFSPQSQNELNMLRLRLHDFQLTGQDDTITWMKYPSDIFSTVSAYEFVSCTTHKHRTPQNLVYQSSTSSHGLCLVAAQEKDTNN